MAELPDLGEHCQFDSCQQLDFLPIRCTNCDKIFCKIHSSWSSHGCKEPIKQVILPSNSAVHYDCSYKECNNRELIDVKCEHCEKQFCMKHRHQVDHDCVSLPVKPVELSAEERLKAITGREMSTEKKGRTGVKNEARQLKVALMKMKMSAVGDKGIPQNERVYFNINLPQGHQDKAMFFSKEWTAGKVIDKISSTVGLSNQNVTSKKKLRLFESKSGQLLPSEQTLNQLVDTDLVRNGCDVILEYVEGDVTVIKT